MRPYLRVANVFEDHIDTADVLSMNFDPHEYEVYKLEPNDILLNEGQSLNLVGRPALYRGEVAGACFQNTLVRFRARPEVVPKYALSVFRYYLHSGRFQPRASVQTMANAMDVGHPSNFERMAWLYDHDVDAMRRDVVGSRYVDGEVTETIRRVYETRGYLLDPHSAIAYLGISGRIGTDGRNRTAGMFLATAHPAKFAEIVEPIIGRVIEKPKPLGDALARRASVLSLPATLEAVKGTLGA